MAFALSPVVSKSEKISFTSIRASVDLNDFITDELFIMDALNFTGLS